MEPSAKRLGSAQVVTVKLHLGLIIDLELFTAKRGRKHQLNPPFGGQLRSDLVIIKYPGGVLLELCDPPCRIHRIHQGGRIRSLIDPDKTGAAAHVNPPVGQIREFHLNPFHK